MNFSFTKSGIRRKIINLIFQTSLIQVHFFQLVFIIGKFFIHRACICLHSNSLFNLFRKIGIAYQFLYGFNYKRFNICFPKRCFIIAMMTSLLLISAAYIIVNFLICAVFICPCVFIRVHRAAAKRTFQYSCQKMRPVFANL